MKINEILKQLINMVTMMAPMLGDNVLVAVERMVTLPQKDVKKLCAGMSEEDATEAVRLSRVMADSISDFVVFVSSRGNVDPD